MSSPFVTLCVAYLFHHYHNTILRPIIINYTQMLLSSFKYHFIVILLLQTALSIFFQEVAIPAGANGIAAPHYRQVINKNLFGLT